MNDIAARLAKLDPARRALVEDQLRRRRKAAQLPARPPDGRLPLSHAQKRLWFLHYAQPDDAPYLVYEVLRASGPLDVGAFDAAVRRAVARHEALRTSFHLGPDGPVQVVHQSRVDRGADIEACAASELDRLVAAEIRRGFDLEAGELMRVTVFEVDDGTHTIVFVLHHIICDGWALGVLAGEMLEDYAALVAGARLPERPPAMQPGDVALSELQRFGEQALTDARARWTERLRGASDLVGIATDRPPVEATGAGGRIVAAVASEAVERLEGRAMAQSATPFAVLLACWAAALSRHSGDVDICVGVPVAGRDSVDVESTVGCLVNTVVIRVDIDGRPSLAELVGRCRAASLDAFSDAVPFEALVDALPGHRSARRLPLFSTMFTLQDAPIPELTAGPLTLRVEQAHNASAKVDLALVVTPREEEWTAAIEYSTDLFDESTVAGLMTSFLSMVDAVVAHPEVGVDAVDIVGDQGRAAAIEIARGAVTEARTAALHLNVTAQAERTPDAVAVIGDAGQISYREFDGRANWLAAELSRSGVGKGDLVGVLIERSPDFLVAVHAVLRLGAVYVPLDVDMPVARLRSMVESAEVPWLLMRPDDSRAEALSATSVIPMQPGLAFHAPLTDAGGRAPRVSVDDLVHVIHTSGSTGTPKGVMSTHGGLANRIGWMQRTYPIGVGDRVLHKTPCSFDVSVWELLWPLTTGATVVVAASGVHRDPEAMAGAIERYGVTHVHIVPTTARALVESAAFTACRGLVTVFSSGEVLPADIVDAFHRLNAHVGVHNLYGPTEASIDVTAWACPRPTSGDVPIGRPIDNVQTYVLDDRLDPVPRGAAGELHIAGVALARGYLGQPRITADAFRPNPFGPAGSRMYRTGDRVRVRTDGALAYLGRTDFQVKIGGVRIEPGEVEAALRRHEAVVDVAVIAEIAESPRLVAFVATRRGTAVDEVELRRHLRTLVPPALVPSAFQIVDALPLNAAGKLDRAALPAIDMSTNTRPPVAGSQRERQLVSVWERVLGRSDIEVTDEFWAVGGDSIQALRVVTEARRVGVELTVSNIFDHPTIRELARVVREQVASAVPTQVPFALLTQRQRFRLPDTAVDAYPLAALQATMVFDTEATGDRSLYHDVVSLHLIGAIDRDSIGAALDEVIGRHPSLRTSFVLDDPDGPFQVVHAQGRRRFERVDLTDLDLDEQDRHIQSWLAEEAQTPFVWHEPSLLRVVLHDRGPESFQLTLSCHNVIVDGWSLATLLTDLWIVASAGLDALPPMAPATYASFVAAEQEAERSAEAAAFWAAELARARPADLRPWRATGATGRGRHRMELDGDLAGRLVVAGQRLGVPLKSVLLAAHLRVMGEILGTSTPLTGLVVNGRPETMGSESALGLFLNIVPVHGRTDAPWEQLLLDARDAERRLQRFRRFPSRSLRSRFGTTGWFDSAFNYVNFHVFDRLDEIPGLTVLDVTASGDESVSLWVEAALAARSKELSVDITYDRAVVADDHLADIVRRFDIAFSEIAAMAGGERAVASPAPGALDLRRVGVSRSLEDAPSLIDRFDEQVDERPDTIALRQGHTVVTYGELARHVQLIAQRLIDAGVRRHDVVASILERGLAAPAALLAVWRIGAVYFPLSPAMSSDELVAAMSIAGAKVVICEHDVVGSTTVSPSPTSGSSAAAVLPRVVTHLDDPSHILLTSGSTGTPKAVLSTHRQIVSRLEWMWSEHPWDDGEVAAFKTDLTWIDSLWEMLGGLLRGVPTSVLPPEVTRDIDRLLAQLDVDRVSRLWVVPSLLRAVLQSGADVASRLGALRHVVCTGELLPADLIHIAESSLPRARVHNLFGTTEVWDVAMGTLPHLDVDLGGSASIGDPIWNRSMAVVDDQRRPTAIGAAGELSVGGTGLALGYVGRPAATAAAFVPDPDGPPGSRQYLTGDRAVRMPSGHIAVIGRLDDQLNIRGRRIEAGEVEGAMRAVPGVYDAVAVAVDGGSCLLVAAVVDGNTTLAAVREWARSNVAAHLVPDRLVLVGALPRTPSGKPDRRALIERVDRPSTSRSRPVTPTEDILLSIVTEVMASTTIAVDDNIFHGGATSLVAMRIAARARRALGRDIDVNLVLTHPDVRSLAAVLEHDRPGIGADRRPVLVGRGKRVGPVRASHAQRRLWFVHELDPASPAYNVFVSAHLDVPLDRDHLQAAVTALVDRHDALRTTFELDGDELWQIVHADLPADVDWVTIDDGSDPAQTHAVLEAAVRSPFDLGSGPLLRLVVVASATGFDVVLVVHHIACDGWSLDVLVGDLLEHYNASMARRWADLVHLNVGYADYAEWERSVLTAELTEGLVASARARLHAAVPVSLAGGDRQDRDGVVVQEIEADLARETRRWAVDHGATPFTAIVAAVCAALAIVAGREDVVIGMDVSGRGEPELDAVVGCFVNQVPLRVDLSGDPSMEHVLSRTRDAMRAASAEQQLPFDVLVDALRPADGRPRPLFNVKLAQQVGVRETRPLPDAVRTSPYALTRDAAQIELNVRTVDTGSTVLLSAEHAASVSAETVSRLLRVAHRVLSAGAAPTSASTHLSDIGGSARGTDVDGPGLARPAGPRSSRRRTLGSSVNGYDNGAAAGPRFGFVPSFVAEVRGLDATAWAADNTAAIEAAVTSDGVVLLRGFDVGGAPGFQRLVEAVYGDLVVEHERTSPRHQVFGHVFSSTDHPADEPIFVHNEMSYANRWPTRVAFHCVVPAAQGGATPLCDSSRMLDVLPPDLVERFRRRRVQYVRNYSERFGLSWHVSFGTHRRQEVEGLCAASGMTAEWLPDGGLRTRRVMGPTIRHATTGTEMWFNHATFFHPSTLTLPLQQGLLLDLEPVDLPTCSFHGDGAPIDPADLDVLRDAYRTLTVSFPWLPGDVLLLDNERVAHGREPFRGSREVLVTMARPRIGDVG